MNLKPLKDFVLVEIKELFDSVIYVEEKFDTKTTGLCLAVGDDKYKHLKGKQIYWEKYSDGQHIMQNDKSYTFIKIDKIEGYQE